MTSYHFCFDENVSHYLVHVLQHLRVDCSHMADHHARGTKDPELLPLIGKNGWVLVTGDASMLKAHAQVLAENNVKALFLPGSFASGGAWHQAEWIFKHWRGIESQVRAMEDFRMAKVAADGTVKVVEVRIRNG